LAITVLHQYYSTVPRQTKAQLSLGLADPLRRTV